MSRTRTTLTGRKVGRVVLLLVRFVHDRKRRVEVVQQLGTAATTAGATDRAVVVVGGSGDRVLIEASTHGKRRRCDVRKDGAWHHLGLRLLLLLLLLRDRSGLDRYLLHRHRLGLLGLWRHPCDRGRLLLLLQCRLHVLLLLLEKLFQLQEMAQLKLFVFDVLPLKQQLQLLPGAGHQLQTSQVILDGD